MRYNRWHIYSEMKRQWWDRSHVMTVKEVVTAFPGADMEELTEGMIEFQLVYDRDLKHQQVISQELPNRVTG